MNPKHPLHFHGVLRGEISCFRNSFSNHSQPKPEGTSLTPNVSTATTNPPRRHISVSSELHGCERQLLGDGGFTDVVGAKCIGAADPKHFLDSGHKVTHPIL